MVYVAYECAAKNSEAEWSEVEAIIRTFGDAGPVPPYGCGFASRLRLERQEEDNS